MGETIVFFGNERLATGVSTSAPTLQRLLDEGYDVAAVVLNNEATASRHKRVLEIAALAEQHHVPVLMPTRPADILAELKSYNAAAAVLVAYGKIVPQSVIDIFPAGIVNVHPSLLPLHRGPTPLESVILEGSPKTGVSLMRLAREMDAGPVYAYSEVDLSGHETKQELADDLIELGSSMVAALLPRIISGEVSGKPQDNALATYDKLINKEDGILDWGKPAVRLEREVRAYQGWPQSRTILGGHAVIITAAHIINDKRPTINDKHPLGRLHMENKTLAIQTTDGELSIDRLKPAGKADMPIAAFLAGYAKDL